MFTKEVDDQIALLEALIIRLRYEHDSGAVNGTTYVARSLERSAFKLREMLEPSPKKTNERLEVIASLVACKLIELDYGDMGVIGKRSMQAAKALVEEWDQENTRVPDWKKE